MANLGRTKNSTTKAMALNVAAWLGSSVTSLGVPTFRTQGLWWRKPGGSPIYLSAVVTDAEVADDAILKDLRLVKTAWETEEMSVWDCWAVCDLTEVGFKRQWIEPWYLRRPSPLPANFTLPTGVSIEAVTTEKILAEFEEASWAGFETSGAGRTVGRFGQHAVGTLNDPGMHYLLARLDGRVVASTIAYATRDMLGIYGISTLPEFRKRGYASALVRSVVCLRSDLPVSVQPDPESTRIYSELGFISSGHVAAWHDAI